MKRSEMLDIIEYAIEDYLGDKIFHPDILANQILMDIEKAGMLPPELNPIPQYIIDNCESANIWEPEND